MENIEKYITGAVAVFLSITKLVSWYMKRRRVKLNEKRLKNFIEDSKYCNSLCNTLTQEGIADRVIIFRAHDSGGIPKLGLPYYVSVVYPSYRERHRDKSKRYHNIHVDDPYKDIILDLINKGKVEIITSELREGMIKDIYEDEGIVYGCLYKLAITNSSFFYMSISWFTEPTDSQLIDADLRANQIQTVYSKHHKNS
jgi:hypothetical protein